MDNWIHMGLCLAAGIQTRKLFSTWSDARGHQFKSRFKLVVCFFCSFLAFFFFYELVFNPHVSPHNPQIQARVKGSDRDPFFSLFT